MDEFENLVQTPSMRVNKLRSIEHEIEILIEKSQLTIPVKVKVFPKNTQPLDNLIDYIESIAGFVAVIDKTADFKNKSYYINRAKKLKRFGEHIRRLIANDERQEKLDWVKKTWAELYGNQLSE